MTDAISYQKLNKQEYAQLSSICKRRWRKVLKGLLITYSLPIIVAGAIWLYFDLIEFYSWLRHGYTPHYIYPKSISQFWSMAELNVVVWFPAFVLITIANCVFIAISIPRVYIDMIRGIKKKIPFYPTPYYVSESDQYYIKTNLAEFDFLQVSYEDYNRIKEQELLILEIFPATRAYLDLKTADEQTSIKTNHCVTRYE